jgi:hypothetical protein
VTKLYVLTAAPVILFVYIYRLVKCEGQRVKILNCFLGFGLTALALCAPWLILNLGRYGTWNPAVHSVATKDLDLPEKLKFLGLVDWKGFAFSNLIGLLWSGNWSFVTFPSVVYKLFFVVLVLFAGAFVRLFTRHFPDRPRLNDSVLLASFSAAFLIGMVRHQIDIRMAGNLDPMGGWYWTALLPTHTAILFLTLRSSLRGAFLWCVLLILVIAYLLSQWCSLGMLLPYYTGLLTKPQIADSLLHAFPIAESLKRISDLNFLPMPLLPFLWAAESALFALAVFISFRQSRRTPPFM